MKATGVVRRIDELGRIVIPKEIRRKLKIREGESIEIFTDNSNQIILKKYSLEEDYDTIINSYLETLYPILKNNILITDRDKFITGIGDLKKECENKEISSYLLKLIDKREKQQKFEFSDLNLHNNLEINCSYIIEPIISSGEAIGLIIVISKNQNLDSEVAKIIEVAANFLGKYIEN